MRLNDGCRKAPFRPFLLQVGDIACSSLAEGVIIPDKELFDAETPKEYFVDKLIGACCGKIPGEGDDKKSVHSGHAYKFRFLFQGRDKLYPSGFENPEGMRVESDSNADAGYALCLPLDRLKYLLMTKMNAVKIPYGCAGVLKGAAHIMNIRVNSHVFLNVTASFCREAFYKGVHLARGCAGEDYP